MKHFSERLKAARKMNGFSLQDLSDAIQNKLNKQALNRLETGEAKPDSETISLLSKVLKVNSDYFFRESTVVLDDIRFRKLKKLSAKEQDKVTSNTIEFLERYLELEDLLGIDNDLKFKPKAYKIRSAKDVEIAAQQIRFDWKLGQDPLPNIIEMLEENSIKVFQLSVDKSFSGMSTIIKDKIAVIVLNSNKDIPIVRQRFTALHELAHLYLDLTLFEGDDKECEKMCDLFAGALLFPEEKIKSYLGIKRSQIIMKELYLIAAHYGISIAAIIYRAYTVGIITPSYFKFCMISYNKYNTKDKEYTVYIHEEGSDRFLQLLIRGVAEEVISTTKAASLNGQKLGDFREILDSTAR